MIRVEQSQSDRSTVVVPVDLTWRRYRRIELQDVGGVESAARGPGIGDAGQRDRPALRADVRLRAGAARTAGGAGTAGTARLPGTAEGAGREVPADGPAQSLGGLQAPETFDVDVVLELQAADLVKLPLQVGEVIGLHGGTAGGPAFGQWYGRRRPLVIGNWCLVICAASFLLSTLNSQPPPFPGPRTRSRPRCRSPRSG